MTWWIEASSDSPELVSEFRDYLGNGLASGNVAIVLGDGEGAVIEGTYSELISYFRGCLALVEVVPPNGGR
jgi:hypothetical protein